MKIEYEATFPNINKDKIRERLKKSRRAVGAAGIFAKKMHF